MLIDDKRDSESDLKEMVRAFVDSDERVMPMMFKYPRVDGHFVYAKNSGERDSLA